MFDNKTRTFNTFASTACILVLAAACNVNVQKDEEGRDKKVTVNTPVSDIKVEKKDGKDKNVSITTPFGSLKVNTDKVQLKDIGITLYPGAKEAENSDNTDNAKANVSINSPFLSLRVLAMKYQTPDSTDKVWEFYKKDLKQFGRVLECRPGSPDLNIKNLKSTDELTCEDNLDDNGSTKVKTSYSDQNQLRAGTREHYHLVTVRAKDGGTEFGLAKIGLHEGDKDAN